MNRKRKLTQTKIFSCLFIDKKLLKSVIECLDQLSLCEVCVSEKGLTIRGKDDGNISLMRAEFTPEAFGHGFIAPPKPVIVWVDTKGLSKSVNMFGSHQAITLSQTDEDHLTIESECTTIDLSLVNCDDLPPTKDWGLDDLAKQHVAVTLKSQEFARVVEQCNKVQDDDRVDITVTPTGLELMLKSTIMSVAIELNGEVAHYTSSFTQAYRLRYLKYFIGISADRVVLHIHREKPMVVHYEFPADQGQIDFLLAAISSDS